jgi:uncharacterized protein
VTSIVDLLTRVAGDVAATISTTWPFLVASIVAAAALDVYVGTDRLGGWLRRRSPVAVLGAVVLAAATPFCSCGTTAVTLGMLATAAPWAPIVAFMVASPLTSPSELLLSGGLLGWPFAWLFFGGTIVLGILAGVVSHVADRAGWLQGQARMEAVAAGACGTDPASATAGDCGTQTASVAAATSCCDGPAADQTPVALSVGPGAAAMTEVGTWRQRARLDDLARATWGTTRRLVPFFLGFTALGYLLIEAIPTAWIEGWLGGDGIGSIVAAALLGIPAYVNTEGSLPLVAGLVDGGMGPGAAMAFLVTGAGTSIGAIGGMLLIARRRVVGLVVALLFTGAIGLGTVAQVLLG